MYQQRIDTDSASLEGMEEVFEEKAASLPADHNRKERDLLTNQSLPAGNLVLRGTYNQGVLLLREEVLKPLSVDGGSTQGQPGRILYSRNNPGESLRSFDSESLQHNGNSRSAGLIETNPEILELIKKHAEQAKVANELIKCLSEQVREQRQYIERLHSGRPSANIWMRLWSLIRGRTHIL